MRLSSIVSIGVVLCLINFSICDVNFIYAKDAATNEILYVKIGDGGCKIHLSFAKALFELDSDKKIPILGSDSAEQGKLEAIPTALANAVPTGADDLCLIEIALKDQGRRLNLML